LKENEKKIHSRIGKEYSLNIKGIVPDCWDVVLW
jgi:hypothetical protein